MDGTALLESLGGNQEILHEVVAVFLEVCPEQLAAVGRSVTSHDAPGLAANAHRLKGSVSLFGAAGATEAASRLEMAGASGNLGGVDETYQRLESEVSELEHELRALLAG